MNTPVPTRSSSPVIVAIVGIAGAVAGSLAVWTALAPGQNEVPATDHTCHCECVTESVDSAAVPEVSETEPSETEPAAPRPVLRVSEAAGMHANSGEENGAGTPTLPRVRQARPEVVGTLDRDIIRRIVRAHVNEVRHCYNEGLSADPTLSGRVSIQFTIGNAGKVLESVVAASTLEEDDAEEGVATCISTAVKRWHFPKVEGEAVVVTYPFVLTPGWG